MHSFVQPMSPASRDNDGLKTTRDASDVAAKTAPPKSTRPLQTLKDNPRQTWSSGVAMHVVDGGDKAESPAEQQDISSPWITMSTFRSLADQSSSCPTSQANANPLLNISSRNVDDMLDQCVPSNDTSSYQTLDSESTYSNPFSTEASSIYYSYPSEVIINVDLDTLGIGAWVDDASLMNSARNVPPPQRSTTSYAHTLSMGPAVFIPFVMRGHGDGAIHGKLNFEDSQGR